MRGRLVSVAVAMLATFSILVARLEILSMNQEYAAAAHQQSEEVLALSSGRGNIYDCNFIPLTNTQYTLYGLFSPGRASYRQWFDAVDGAEKETFYQQIQRATPFLIPVNGEERTLPMYTFQKEERYMTMPIAPHLIGYLNAEEQGVAGVEYAYNSLLEGSSTQEDVWCATNAYGAFIANNRDEPRLVETRGSGAGVMLTLDERIQRICESVALTEIDRGCIVVLETKTGRVRASVSMPTFDPEDIAASIERNDTSLINRPVSAFNVGSVFKPLIAAQALTQGFSAHETYECTGSIELSGHVYRCAYGKGHGVVDMEQALEQSCNCYFIHLGLQLGAQGVHDTAFGAGFGQSTPLAGQLETAAGNLPSAAQLQDKGQLASVSFGQGALTATPLQVAAFMNLFANRGTYIAPTFVEGLVNEYDQSMMQSLYAPVQRQVFSEEIAEQVRRMLVGVVEDGLGKAAKPELSTAGGKTGTAQTGRYDENGEEKMDAWFAGFYPAEEPRYTVAVMLDEGDHGSTDAARIFRKVAEALYYFEGCPEADTDVPVNG